MSNLRKGLIVSQRGFEPCCRSARPPIRSAPHQRAEPGRLNALAPTCISEIARHVSNGHKNGQSHRDEDDPKEEELVRMHGTSPLISSDIPAAWTVLVGGICHNSIMNLTRCWGSLKPLRATSTRSQGRGETALRRFD